jgi:hypothetical protein
MKFLQTFNWQDYDEARKGGNQASHTAHISSLNAHQLNTRASHSFAKMHHEAAAHAHGKAEQEAKGFASASSAKLHGNAKTVHQRMAAEHGRAATGQTAGMLLQRVQHAKYPTG